DVRDRRYSTPKPRRPAVVQEHLYPGDSGARGREVASRRVTSPLQRLREELVDQVVVKRLEFLQVRFGVALGVKIVRIEGAHGVEHLPVLVVHEVIVLAITMGRIKGMIPD